MEKITAKSIGIKGAEILKGGGVLFVKGGTTRGIFLENETGWSLFLSEEKFRGPLTVNLSGPVPEKASFTNTSVGKITDGEIEFSDIGVVVKIKDAEVWEYQPVYHIGLQLQGEKAIALLESLEHAAINTLFGRGTTQITNDPTLVKGIQLIPELVYQRDYQGAIEEIGGILGLGEGLTPEGDDFVIGHLFYLRIASILGEGNQDFASIFNQSIDLARKKTTRLSANLIECAAQGQVDERISRVVESLASGRDLLKSIAGLMTWGNTSGRMALAGIAAGVLAVRD